MIPARSSQPKPAVHPHARGENCWCHLMQICYSGSPPRAWGKFRIALRHADRVRFTPTRVGKMSHPSRSSPGPSVHPHARGENQYPIAQSAGKPGSPPRAWGKWTSVAAGGDDGRFTPTRVGKISRLASHLARAAVHPHARGENARIRFRQRRPCGSPPRAWGKFGPETNFLRASRFTPTRVGKIPVRPRVGRLRAVHPHARGENAQSTPHESYMCGSPPRAWGK